MHASGSPQDPGTVSRWETRCAALGVTIRGLADGNNWVVPIILINHRDGFAACVRLTSVPVKQTVSAAAR